VLITDVPYQGAPPPGAHCQGGIPGPDDTCYYEAFGNETAGNFLKHNGFFGNPTNGDLALAAIRHDPGNCFHGHTDPDGVTSDPPDIQGPPWNPCGQPNGGDEGPLVGEALCATQLIFPCPQNPAADYPRPTQVKLRPIPHQASMPNPCVSVPANPWCPAGAGATSASLTAAGARANTTPGRREEWGRDPRGKPGTRSRSHALCAATLPSEIPSGRSRWPPPRRCAGLASHAGVLIQDRSATPAPCTANTLCRRGRVLLRS
jgi:hypothetical protein